MANRAAFRWLAVSAGLVYAAGAAYLYAFTADDAYIVARYAENWVDFGALEFNLGERILAITSPLHAGLEAALYSLTGATLPSYKLVALALVVLAIGLLLREFAGDLFGSSMTLVVVALSPCVLLWTFGGLETPMLLFLATLLAVLATGEGSWGRGRLIAVFFVAGLCLLTRYDSCLFAGPLVLYAAVQGGRSPGRLLPAIGIGGALPAAWLVCAWLYYGDVLPTAYYVKMPGVGEAELLRNVSYLAQCFTVTGVLPLLAWIVAECRPRRRLVGVARSHFRHSWGLYLGVLAMVGYGLWVATAHMFFAFRYFVPYLPAAVLLLGGLARDCVACRGPGAHESRVGTRFLIVAFGLLLFQGYQIFHTYNRSMNGIATVAEYLKTGSKAYEEGMMATRIAVAADIRRHWAGRGFDRGPRIYTTAGGILPYTYREAYFLERLVSYRSQCEYERAELAVFADYVHFLSPRHGRVGDNLGRSVRHYELVSARFVIYDGVLETALTFFDPYPRPSPLPSRIHESCDG